MNPASYLVIATTLSILCLVLKRNFQQGLALAFGCMVAFPSYMAIALPGPLPQLTIQRLILATVFIFYVNKPDNKDPFRNISLLKPILILASAQFISTIFSINITSSIKNFISFNIEIMMFFMIVHNSMSSKDSNILMVKSACIGISAVAAIAAIEKYTGVNISGVITGVPLPKDPIRATAVLSTFTHRIPLGYAMAIGLALQFTLARLTNKTVNGIAAWGAVILLSAVCYFSDSRGAWMGMIIAVLCIGALSGQSARKALGILGAIAFALLIARPGVQQAILNRYYATISQDAVQGHSYRYRWVLWHVAWSEIGQSPLRLLVGYGGLSTEVMDLSHYFTAGEGGSVAKLGYTSWDNQYAANLVEFGALGFIAELVVYLNALWLLARRWKRAKGADREFQTALIASAMIYLFAMTNVYMFSDQLRYLFWGLLALGCQTRSSNNDALELKLLHELRAELDYRQQGYSNRQQTLLR